MNTETIIAEARERGLIISDDFQGELDAIWLREQIDALLEELAEVADDEAIDEKGDFNDEATWAFQKLAAKIRAAKSPKN